MSQVDSSRPFDRTGQVLGGRYRLLSVLGSGGQSIVYRAEDVRDGDIVAVKVLNTILAQDAEARERMFREANAMTTLQGTAAVRALDQTWTDDGSFCLVMELLEGKDLEDLLRDIERSGAVVPVAALMSVLEPIAHTLDVAHSHGIVHRDLKPANIFCISPDKGGGVRLLDFGFAKFTRSRGLTAVGMIAGSPSYIAPEAWRGKAIDHRSDVYALGAIVFRAWSGKPPFASADLSDLLRLATTGERPSLYALRPDLPPAIDDWLRQALAADPDDRFMRVGAMWAALRHTVGV